MSYTRIRSYFLLVVKVIIFFWSSQSYSSIIYNATGNDSLSRLDENDEFVFSENYIDQLNKPSFIDYSFLNAAGLQHTIGDKKALELVAKLLANGDKKGPLALANYLERYPKDLIAYQFAAIQLVGEAKYPQAVLALKEVLKTSPNYTPGITLMGIALLMQGEYHEGSLYLEKAINNNNASILAYRHLSWNYLRNNEYIKAKQTLERSLKIEGIPIVSATIAHLELAEMYRLRLEHEKITILFQQLVDNESLDLSLKYNEEAISRYFEAAVASENLRAAKKAEQIIMSAAAYNSAPVIISRSLFLGLLGKVDEAITLINTIDSDDFYFNQDLLLTKARLYLKADMNKQGMLVLQQYIDNFDDQLTISRVTNYIELSIALNEGNRALSYLKELVNENDKNLSLSYLLAQSLLQSGDLTAAMDEANKILEKDADFAKAYYIKGVVSYNRNQNKDASSFFQRAVEIEPSYIEAWLALFGAMHDHRQHSHSQRSASMEHEELIPTLKRAISKNPNEPIFRYELGLTLYSGGSLYEAQKEFDESLRLVPFDLSSLYMSSIVRADRNEDLKTATELARIASLLVPENPIVQDSYGWALIRSGEVNAGLEYSQNALKGAQDDPVIQLHIGYGHYLLEDYKIAKLYFIDALNGDLPPHSAELIRDSLQKMEPVSEKVIVVNKINGFGVGEKIGTIKLVDSSEGLMVETDIHGLPPGLNGMHFHENPSCDAGFDGSNRVTGQAAGGHYGHAEHGSSMTTDMTGHDHSAMLSIAKGDLPPLETGENGRTTATVIGTELVLSELRARSLVIHHGPDLNGISGEKVACAVID